MQLSDSPCPWAGAGDKDRVILHLPLRWPKQVAGREVSLTAASDTPAAPAPPHQHCSLGTRAAATRVLPSMMSPGDHAVPAHDVAGRGSGQGLTLTLPHQTSPHPPVSPHGLHRSTFHSSVRHPCRTTKSREPIRPRYGRNVQSKGNILLVQVPTAAFPTGGSTHGQASSRKSRKQSSPRTCPGWWDLESTEKSRVGGLAPSLIVPFQQ